MLTSRCALMLAFGLMLSAGLGNAAAAQQLPIPGPAPQQVPAPGEAPHISKPKPAPPGPSSMPPLPPAVFDPSLAIGGENIKAREVETRMTVAVQVNGRGPYRFVVDSGADTSAVSINLARDLQLPLGTPAILDGMTERNIVDRVKVSSLTLGSSTIGDLEVPALREVDLGGDGMLGIDALVKQRLLMDFENRTIKVEDARRPPEHFTDEIVITARRQHGQLILTEVRAGGIWLDAIIDTGSEITIGNLALRDKLIRRAKKDWTIPVTGVTGKTVDLQLGNIRDLRLGPIMLEDVPIAFADVPPFKVFGLEDQPALLLGTDILENFRKISLDFRARKVRFQIKHCGTTSLTISTSPSETTTRLSATGGMEVCGA